MDGNPFAQEQKVVTSSTDFSVRFWGVRGSIACPGPDFVRYGGNTSCLEIRCGDKRLVFDAGTGIRALGLEMAQCRPNDLDIFFTHTHFDHVCGLTFFSSLFCPDSTVRLWAGHLEDEMTLRGVLTNLMMAPLYPVSLEIFQAKVSFNDFRAGQTLTPHPGVTLRTALLNHPNGATGYRVEFGGKSICYITDTEHYPDHVDETIAELVRGADIMIYDATYTDDEYPTYRGWGHSTWQEGLKLAKAAGVKQYVVFHHDPSHSDAFMDSVARDVDEAKPGSVVAREGMVLRP
jgi:phosphoribosyl 1,2-cyclic phosphodiesterase